MISETSVDSEHDEKVQRLEKEVSEMKTNEQELNATMVQLRNKIRELENVCERVVRGGGVGSGGGVVSRGGVVRGGGVRS